jgi:hypothetical protein
MKLSNLLLNATKKLSKQKYSIKTKILNTIVFTGISSYICSYIYLAYSFNKIINEKCLTKSRENKNSDK